MLLPIILGEEKGDRVFLLLHSEGKADGRDHLKDECVSVLTHAVLEGEGDGYTRLESALKELNGLLKGFLLSGSVKDVHAVVGLLESDGTIHLSHVGRAEAYVVRDGTATQVTEYYRGKPPAAFMHIVSGAVESKDHFIIATQRLLRSMTPAQLTHLVKENGDGAVEAIVSRLADDKEVACVLHIAVAGAADRTAPATRERAATPERRRGAATGRSALSSFLGGAKGLAGKVDWRGLGSSLRMKKKPKSGRMGEFFSGISEWVRQIFKDLKHPERKRRAHLFILAGSVAIFIVIWMTVQLTVTSQRSQTKGELQALLQQISSDISTADNRELAGDSDSANALLSRAEENAHKVMTDGSGLYRTEALELLDRIKSKREEMNHIVRVVPPRVMANLSGKKADILAQGMIGLSNGEFVVYDRQDLFRVSLNTVESGEPIGTEELILDGVDFPRFQSRVFMTTGNSLVEIAGGQASAMKTEDPSGWVTGADIKTYLRYLYVLSPERKQIYKYERLSSRYGPPAEYNVNGDLSGALDMTITGPVYVLRDASADPEGKAGQRTVVKLLRGEKQTMNIRNLPPGGLENATKIFRSNPNGNFYFMDPIAKRVIVSTNDGDIGDSLYLRQYVLDSEQVGTLKDLYVDPEDTRLYVLDEKHVYAIDLQAK